MDKPFAVTLDVGSSLANKTGSWRTFRPVYVDRLPPCNNQCPAGENIQSWLYLAEEGNYEAAWRRIMEENPFPAAMGRVCYHTCETACNRGKVDEPVGINAVERFLGDQAIRHGWKIEPGAPTGKKVMIVGGGPGGLSCAYHLARLGHQVTVFEASPKAGGMLRYGIPKYRMPREKLNAEIQRIRDMGVDIRLGTPVDDLPRTMGQGGFDACFLAVGAQLGRRIDIPQSAGHTGPLPILDAVQVLRQLELEEAVPLTGRVVIYGGGNTAIDVARSALRLGALSATVVVLEAREHMPAHDEEIKEAVDEGVAVVNLRSLVAIDGTTLTLEIMVPGESRWPVRSGQLETIEADVLVQALGQSCGFSAFAQLAGMTVADGVVQVDYGMQTGARGIFAGGDMVPSRRNVTTAIGHGKRAARAIDAWLEGEAFQPKAKHEVADVGKMNPWYYSDAPRTIRPILDVVRRTSGFAEVVGDLDEGNALFEARRCMSCGNCFECDNCYGVCPDNAVIKLGPGQRFQFNYEYCKGCGICVSECPCGAISMEPETL
ncbi:MAG TPA: NAD(P)-binding protein [Rhodocyclaceae bacterium]|nr:NAD(P)-binding protein [Rhodocyclaceae bacterium]